VFFRLLAVDRPEGSLEGHKAHYAKKHAPVKNLQEVVEEIKPSILIGASAAAGAFTPEILSRLAEYNDRPVVFALRSVYFYGHYFIQ